MKAISTISLAMVFLATAANAQFGAKADSVMIPKPGGVMYLKNCMVTKVEPDGVRVMHDGGAAKVPYDFMPEAWKAAIPYDRDEAEDFQKRTEREAKDAAEESDFNNAVLHEDPDGSYTGRVITKEDVMRSWAELAEKLQNSESDSNSPTTVNNHYSSISSGGGSVSYIYRHPLRPALLARLAARGPLYRHMDVNVRAHPLDGHLAGRPGFHGSAPYAPGSAVARPLHFTVAYSHSGSNYPVFKYAPPVPSARNGTSVAKVSNSTGGAPRSGTSRMTSGAFRTAPVSYHPSGGGRH